MWPGALVGSWGSLAGCERVWCQLGRAAAVLGSLAGPWPAAGCAGGVLVWPGAPGKVPNLGTSGISRDFSERGIFLAPETLRGRALAVGRGRRLCAYACVRPRADVASGEIPAIFSARFGPFFHAEMVGSVAPSYG